MKITLKKLILLNFKGVRKFEIDLEDKNYIYGQNEAGKTTLLDAYLWLFFGKDSTGRSDSNFGIKTFDENNVPYHKLSHEVSAIIEVDGEKVELRKLFKEKWVKKRGAAEEEFSGHIKEFYWNDVPMKESDYQAKISGIVNERLFALLSNTSFFNNLSWQDRRSALIQLAGKIEDVEVLDKIATIENKKEVATLTAALNQKKSINEFRDEITSKKRKIKDQLLLLPSRIDEVTRALPEEKDYTIIEEEIAAIKADIESIDAMLMDKTQAQKEHQNLISKLLNQRQGIRDQIQNIVFNIKNKIRAEGMEMEQVIKNKERALAELKYDLTRETSGLKLNEERWTEKDKRQQALRQQFAEINTHILVFDETAFVCPACKRPFEEENIEAKKKELTENFNADKSKKLEQINAEGKSLGEQKDALGLKIENGKSKIAGLQAEIEAMEDYIKEAKINHALKTENENDQETKAIAENEEYKKLIASIDDLNLKINSPAPQVNNDELLERKKNAQAKLDILTKDLNNKDLLVNMQARIKELTEQEQTMAAELASLEGVEFCIEQFIKMQMDELERRVNKRFKLVKFKMFEEQINGGQKETCVTLINGVPYLDANNAGKIQAGLDIINTFSEHFGIICPVWVDNRESVTFLPETKCQLISLIVSPEDKKLRIANNSPVLDIL